MKRTKPPKWLADWRATVPEGRCPACKAELPQGARGRPAYVCPARKRPECRQEYLRRRHMATSGGTVLRRVVAMAFNLATSRQALLTLDCGCQREMSAAEAVRAIRRTRCPHHRGRRAEC